MERATLDQLSTKATISRDFLESGLLSQRQRLERWSELLARRPERRLSTFPPTEYMDARTRDGVRCPDSAVTVAFEDPVLREAGLSDDTYGTAKRFFGLTDHQMHWILCYCHHGVSTRAGVLSALVRSFVPRSPDAGILGWVRRLFAPSLI